MKVPGFKGVPPQAVLKRLVKEFQEDAVTDSAAQLSYYLLFALFPFLMFLVTLTAYLPLGHATQDLLGRLNAVMPHEAMGVISDHLNNLLNKPKPHLLGIGILTTFYSASRGADAFRKSLNIAYDVHESRPFWKTNAAAFAATLFGSLLGLLGIAMIAAGGKAGEWVAAKVHLDQQFVMVWSWLRWPTTALVIMLVAALAYFVLPDVEQRFKYITPGSVISTVLWLVATWGFTLYVGHFGNYNATYGSIGGVIILLTWLYISSVVFMIGGELNAVIEHLSQDGKAEGAHAFGEPPAPKSERPSAAPPGAAKKADVADEVHDDNHGHASMREADAATEGQRRRRPRSKPTNAPFFRFWKRPRPLEGPDDPTKYH